MKSFKKTTILLFFAIALTAALGGAYAFFFIAMKNKTAATAELSAKNETLAGKESRVTSALAAIKGENTNIEKLNSYFIKESEIVAFTKKIELLGEQSGTTFSLEALDPGVDENNAPVLNFRVIATGEFQNVMRLAALLENFPGKFKLKSVNLSLGDRAEETADTATTKTPKAPKATEWKITVSLAALNFVKE